MYIYKHIYMYIYMYTYMYIYMYIYKHIYIYIYTHICKERERERERERSGRISACLWAPFRGWAFGGWTRDSGATGTYSHTHICIYIYVCIYVCICMCMYTYGRMAACLWAPFGGWAFEGWARDSTRSTRETSVSATLHRSCRARG